MLALLSLLACEPPPPEFHAYPDADAWGPLSGPGGPATSFAAEALWSRCAALTGGPEDHEHHNLVGMHDGWLLVPWAPEEGGGGVSFFAFDDPCNPEKIGEAYSPLMRESHTLAIGEAGGRTWLAVDAHESGDVGGVGFWDITDPTAPRWASFLPLPDYHYPDAYFRVVLSTFWQGDLVYAGAGLNGVFVIDASDPEHPALIAQHVEPAHLVGTLHMIGDIAMVSSAGMSRTILYDLSDPTDFRPIAGGDFDVVDREGEPTNYYFSNVGGRWGLFARNSDGGGPIVYDLTDPTAPTWLGDAPNDDGDGGYVSRRNHLLYQGDSNFGSVYDATDPGAMVELGRLQMRGDLDTVTPIGNVAVVSVDAGAEPGLSTIVVPVEAEPDAVPPTGELTSPSDGQQWVPLSARIGVSFDEAVEPRSVFEGSFRVWTGDGRPVPGRFNVQETIVNFTPDAPLEAGMAYVVELPAGGVVDLSGNPTAAPLRFTFTTGAWETE